MTMRDDELAAVPLTTREGLDALSCADPLCDHATHPDGLHLCGTCHPHAFLGLTYRDGALVVRCAACRQLIARIAVAERPRVTLQ